LLFVGHVHGDRHGRFAIAQAACRCGRRVEVQIGNDHAGPRLEIAFGNGVADAAGCARDEGHFAVEMHGWCSFSLWSRGPRPVADVRPRASVTCVNIVRTIHPCKVITGPTRRNVKKERPMPDRPDATDIQRPTSRGVGGEPQRRRIAVALQGGGSHGAFTWGVLDRLLEEPSLEIVGVSGTSAGAMNAAVLADGLRSGAAAGKDALRRFWDALGGTPGLARLQAPWMPRSPEEWHFENSPLFLWFTLLSRV